MAARTGRPKLSLPDRWISAGSPRAEIRLGIISRPLSVMDWPFRSFPLPLHLTGRSSTRQSIRLPTGWRCSRLLTARMRPELQQVALSDNAFQCFPVHDCDGGLAGAKERIRFLRQGITWQLGKWRALQIAR